MNITCAERQNVTIVRIEGSIDAMTAPQLDDILKQQTDAGHARLVADFSGVDYMSSAGLRALLATVKEARQHGGDLRLANVGRDVLKVLELSGFTTILKLFPDTDAAAANFG